MPDTLSPEQKQSALLGILRATAGSPAKLVTYGVAAAVVYSISGGDLASLNKAAQARPGKAQRGTARQGVATLRGDNYDRPGIRSN